MGGSHEAFRRYLDRSRTSPALYGLVLLCFLLLITDGYDLQSIAYAAPALIKAWGLGKATMGAVFSVGLAGVMIGAMALTPLADRIGARRVLIGCVCAYAVLTLGTALVSTLPGLMAMRLLSGVALGAVMPNAVALIADHAPTRLRNTLISVIIAGFALGGSLGGLVGALVLHRFGWPSVFFVGAVAPTLLLAPLAWFLPDSLSRVLRGQARPAAEQRLERLVPGYAAWAEAQALGGAQGDPASTLGPVRGLFAGGMWAPTALLWLVYFLNLLMLYTLSSWLPTVLNLDGLSVTAAGLTASSYQLAGVLGMFIGWLCDRLPPGRVLPVAFLGAGAAVFSISAAGASPVLLALGVAASGFFVVGSQTAANAFVSGFYPPSMRATGLGWALGVGRLGSILGPLVAGALLSAGAQPRTLFQLCALAGVIAAAAMALAVWRRPHGPSLPLEAETAAP